MDTGYAAVPTAVTKEISLPLTREACGETGRAGLMTESRAAIRREGGMETDGVAARGKTHTHTCRHLSFMDVGKFTDVQNDTDTSVVPVRLTLNNFSSLP